MSLMMSALVVPADKRLVQAADTTARAAAAVTRLASSAVVAAWKRTLLSVTDGHDKDERCS